MPHFIDQYMWGDQIGFRIAARSRARDLLTTLDPALEPEVLLVGHLQEQREDRHNICVEPEDGDILSDSLVDLDRVVAESVAGDPDSQTFHSHPIASQNAKERIARRGLVAGVERLLGVARPDRLFFASYPQLIEGYLVTAVIHVDREAYECHPSLTHREYFQRYTVPVSLLEAAMTVLRDEFTDGLRAQSPGMNSLPGGPIQDRLRNAGRQLMQNPEFRLGDFVDRPGLFDAFCEVAALRYEGAEGRGRLLITAADRGGIDVTLALVEPVSLHRRRAVRKLLEMASEDLCALMTPQGLYGLGRVSPGLAVAEERVFCVEFLGRNAWELRHSDLVLMRVQDGVPALPRESLSRDSFEFSLQLGFSAETPIDVDRLWNAVAAARQQPHGTILIISSGARTEAGRLSRQSTVIEATPATQEVIASVTAIDGAVLLDPEGSCHAIGVILDGMAVADGDSGRGARFNSALRYVSTARSSFDHQVLALVVSEDGMVDLLPIVRPPIRRAAIEARLAELQRLASEPAPSTTLFLRAEEWLREHRFYLDGATCGEVNRLVAEIDSRLHGEEDCGRVIREPLAQDPGFDPGYLLGE